MSTFQIFDRSTLVKSPGLRESMLKDRGLQFVERHKWALRLTEGALEIDEFDAPGTTYCIVTEAGRHAASVRLRHARDGSMVERHFPELWERFAERLAGLHEVTRLCIAPRAAAVPSGLELSELLIGLCGHCRHSGVPAFFGVVFPSVARALGRAGWAGQVLGSQERPGEKLLLAMWEVTPSAYWQLESELERRGAALAGQARLQAA